MADNVQFTIDGTFPYVPSRLEGLFEMELKSYGHDLSAPHVFAVDTRGKTNFFN